jgi:hypothetical protein
MQWGHQWARLNIKTMFLPLAVFSDNLISFPSIPVTVKSGAGLPMAIAGGASSARQTALSSSRQQQLNIAHFMTFLVHVWVAYFQEGPIVVSAAMVVKRILDKLP